MRSLTDRLMIPIRHLKAGMVFSTGLYIDEQYLLVPPSRPVKEKDILRALSWDLTHLYTDNELGGSSDDGGLSNTILEYHAVFQEKNIRDTYYSLLHRMDLLIQEKINNQKIDTSHITSLANDLRSQVRVHGSEMIRFVHWAKPECSRLARKLVDSSILTAIMGAKLKMSNHNLMNLVMASLLYDIGMIKVDAKVRHKKGALNEPETRLMQKHLLYSYQFIKQQGLADAVAEAVLYHHECWDGSGYTRKIQGKTIPVLSRILAIVDSYTAMIHKKIYGQPLSGYKALKAIISDNGNKYDPELVGILFNIIGVYPLGSLVKLNNSSICMVMELNEKALMRPRLSVIKAQRPGKKTRNQRKSTIIDLIKEKNLYITKAIEPGIKKIV